MGVGQDLEELGPTRRKRLFELRAIGLIVLTAVASMVLAFGLFLAALHEFMTWGAAAADIPLDRARVELAEILYRDYAVKLDPTAKVTAAQEQRGGMQGGRTKWFSVRLARGRGRGFEADFLAAARSKLGPDRLVRVDPESIGPHATELFGWRSKPPSKAHAWHHRGWEHGEPTSTYALFFGDKFYYHWSD